MTFGYSSSFKLSATSVTVGWIGRNSYVVFLSEVTILITYLNSYSFNLSVTFTEVNSDSSIFTEDSFFAFRRFQILACA